MAIEKGATNRDWVAPFFWQCWEGLASLCSLPLRTASPFPYARRDFFWDWLLRSLRLLRLTPFPFARRRALAKADSNGAAVAGHLWYFIYNAPQPPYLCENRSRSAFMRKHRRYNRFCWMSGNWKNIFIYYSFNKKSDRNICRPMFSFSKQKKAPRYVMLSFPLWRRERLQNLRNHRKS